MPVGGAKGVSPVVSIILGSTNELPFTLLDSDEAGKRYQASLRQGLYHSSKEKILEIDTFTGKIGSEIEDLIPPELLINSFNQIFRPEDDFSKEDLDLSEPITPQIEKFANDQGIHLKVGWKVDISKKVKQKFKGMIECEMEDKWVQILDSFQ
ncbi:TPA: hypothetical protein JFQ45_002843 [Legionella pneumophila]|nr:hypothetical protein [Legionella pneumophila]HAU9905886.1 hypothetical protein [Legionella pneumophila]HAU9927332.1 hypothetical protein [Legionella pneumophila]HAU9930265.1 hypothetical protein [Legionella pneumophila]HAU9933935.1 hypothetical protein [Legionella pneumophila]